MERNRTSLKEVTETAREAVKVAKDEWILLATKADRLNNALSR